MNPNRKDIIFVLTQDLKSPSGLGRYFPLAKNLSKHGFSVGIAALDSNYNSHNKNKFSKDGIEINYVAQMHIIKRNHNSEYFPPIALMWISLLATWKLLIHLLLNPASVIVIGKPHPMNSIAGWISGRLWGSKIILDCDDYEAGSNYFANSFQQWVVKLFENLLPKLVDQITTNTFFNKNRMVQLGIPEEKITYIPNGVDRERFQTEKKGQEQQIIKDLPLNGKRIISYIGSLNLDNHPVDLLLKAFRIISEQLSNTNLLVVGGGKDFDHLMAAAKDLSISDDVIFVGRVAPELVPYYYQISNVSVDPVNNTESAKGRCPLKMFESWVMNTPFVTSDVGDRRILAGIPPAIQLTTPGNPVNLAERIIELLQDTRLQKQLIRLGYQRVQKYYWNKILINSLTLFKK